MRPKKDEPAVLWWAPTILCPSLSAYRHSMPALHDCCAGPMASAKPPEKDYYAVLDVPPDADIHLIKKNYRLLVQRYHPDRFQSPNNSEAATSNIIEINE